jgi:hypothetical protein
VLALVGSIGEVAVGAPLPRAYANCTALRVVYPHGVARAGAHDVVRGTTKPVTNFYVSTRLYTLNAKSDGDRDGVACEKR